MKMIECDWSSWDYVKEVDLIQLRNDWASDYNNWIGVIDFNWSDYLSIPIIDSSVWFLEITMEHDVALIGNESLAIDDILSFALKLWFHSCILELTFSYDNNADR